jgi:hypothetical protein
MKLGWVKNFILKTKIRNSEIIIQANKEGLLSLSNHLQRLARDEVIPGQHIHLDGSNGLEDDSVALIIEKIE